MTENIVLIGFMGVGKGRTARELAGQTGNFAVDTDDLIESMQKKKIRDIFMKEGESFFRKLEADVAAWLSSSVQGTIISTGGGFFQVEGLRNIGKIVYLHAELEDIVAAIMAHPKAAKKIKKRPLLRDMEQARRLYQSRLPLYRKVCDLEVDVRGKRSVDVAKEIRALLLPT